MASCPLHQTPARSSSYKAQPCHSGAAATHLPQPIATTKNWFITGVSSGFDASLADLLLEKGDQVAATFRKQEQAADFTKKDYRATVGENLKGIQSNSGRQPGDPERAAQIMYDLVHAEGDAPLHLPLGSAAVKGAREKFASLVKELAEVEETGNSADFPS